MVDEALRPEVALTAVGALGIVRGVKARPEAAVPVPAQFTALTEGTYDAPLARPAIRHELDDATQAKVARTVTTSETDDTPLVGNPVSVHVGVVDVQITSEVPVRLHAYWTESGPPLASNRGVTDDVADPEEFTVAVTPDTVDVSVTR